MSNYNEEALAEGLKYIVTAGKYPHYEQKIACKSLERAEKLIEKLSDEYTDQSVDLYVYADGEWLWTSSKFTSATIS